MEDMVILASWRDGRNNLVDVEILSSKLSEIDILNQYIECKAFYDIGVIGSSDYYAAFADGTRVTLTLHSVINKITPIVITHKVEELESEIRTLQNINGGSI